jgi:hypothetical protein
MLRRPAGVEVHRPGGQEDAHAGVEGDHREAIAFVESLDDAADGEDRLRQPGVRASTTNDR